MIRYRSLKITDQNRVKKIISSFEKFLKSGFYLNHNQTKKFEKLGKDIKTLLEENIGRYDALIALNVLHSPTLDGHALIKAWVKNNKKVSIFR